MKTLETKQKQGESFMKILILAAGLLTLTGCGKDSDGKQATFGGTFSSPVAQSFKVTTGSTVASIRVKQFLRIGSELVLSSAYAASTKEASFTCASGEQVNFSEVIGFNGGSIPDLITTCTDFATMSQELSDHVMSNISGVTFRRYYKSGDTDYNNDIDISNFKFASDVNDKDNAITITTNDGKAHDDSTSCKEDYFFIPGNNQLKVRSRPSSEDVSYCAGDYSDDDAEFYMNNGYIEIVFDKTFDSNGELSSGSKSSLAGSESDYFVWTADNYCNGIGGGSLAEDNAKYPTSAACSGAGGTWTSL